MTKQRKFKVLVKMIVLAETEILASSRDEAYEVADELDGGMFIETEWSFDIDDVIDMEVSGVT